MGSHIRIQIMHSEKNLKVKLQNLMEIYEVLIRCKLNKKKFENNYKNFIFIKLWRIYRTMSASHDSYGVERKCVFNVQCAYACQQIFMCHYDALSYQK